MSLKAFHVVFICCSTVLAVGFGFWSVHEYQMHQGGIGALALAALGFLAAVGLVVYGIWFLGKLKDVSLR